MSRHIQTPLRIIAKDTALYIMKSRLDADVHAMDADVHVITQHKARECHPTYEMHGIYCHNTSLSKATKCRHGIQM